MKYELFECGGHVRDSLLDIQSKDIDYSVVITDYMVHESTVPMSYYYDWFVQQIKDEGYEVFLETKDCLTVRAKFPTNHIHSGPADFVISRCELGYIKGTRTPIVTIGTLEDDLSRRDFTINALARDSSGNIIDLYNGIKDINDRIIRTPGDAAVSFNDDPLRILRALRFACTKRFSLSDEVVDAIRTFNGDFSVVSTERVYEELNKMFNFDTYMTLMWLRFLSEKNYAVYADLFPTPWKLQMTNKK